METPKLDHAVIAFSTVCFKNMAPRLILSFMLVLFAGPAAGLGDEEYLQKTAALEGAIEIISTREGPFSTSLFEPLLELGRLHIAAGDHDSATDALRRAQNVAHRNDGVHTPRQLEAVALLIDMALSDEDFRSADRQKRFAFFITKHHLDDKDPAQLFALAEMADWYMHTGQTQRARRLLEEGIADAEALGRDSLPLTIQLNRARRLGGVCCNTRELLAALEQNTDSDPDTRAQALLEVADAMIMARKPDQAAAYFARAAQVSPLGATAEPQAITTRKNMERRTQGEIYRLDRDLFRDRLRRLTPAERREDETVEPQWFIVDAAGEHLGFSKPAPGVRVDRKIKKLIGQPLLFSEEQLDNLLPFRLEKRKEELRIEVSFTVRQNGDLDDIDIVHSTAPARLNRLLTTALRRIYYRPALQDGAPVTRKNVKLVQTFDPHRAIAR